MYFICLNKIQQIYIKIWQALSKISVFQIYFKNVFEYFCPTEIYHRRNQYSRAYLRNLTSRVHITSMFYNRTIFKMCFMLSILNPSKRANTSLCVYKSQRHLPISDISRPATALHNLPSSAWPFSPTHHQYV